MKHINLFFTSILLLLVAGLTSCEKGFDIKNEKLQEPPLSGPQGSSILTKSEQEMTFSVNDFGFELLRRVDDGKNVFVSPFSVSLALAMLTTGAAANTEAELLKLLGFEGRTTDELDEYFSLLTNRFLTADTSIETSAANSIWPDKTLPVNEKFISDCKKYFNSEVNYVDYQDASTLTMINDWCNKNTNGKIPKILNNLPKGPMTLINAIYFKAKWSFAFHKSKADKGHIFAKIKTFYSENDSMSMVELPYGNGSFAMDVIVPKDGASVQSLTASLDGDCWNGLIRRSEIANVTVSMPEFEFDWGQSIAKVLEQMGMHDAFNGQTADFSRMTSRQLFVADVIHKTYVKVDRNGTEAAAVSAVIMNYSAAEPPSSRNINLTVGKDFIFLIRDRNTGTILFIGRHH